MNNFGEFICSLRKEKSMTQAELAEAVGVTNKAVSKWETGEAMPDTALLLPISRVLGVSVDELLEGKRNLEHKKKKEEVIKEHLFTRGKDDPEERLFDKVKGAVCASEFFVGCVVYLILGMVLTKWHPFWVIIPDCAFLCGITAVIFDLCDKGKPACAKKIIGAVCGIFMLVSLICFLTFSALFNLWHPLWGILVFGITGCALIAVFGELIAHGRKK